MNECISLCFAATSFIKDIGSILTSEMAPNEIEDKVKKLTSAQKFHLLEASWCSNGRFCLPN